MANLRTRYEPVARQAARGAGIDPDIFVRQITQESGWASDVIDCQRSSTAGAQGIAQIVPRFHPNVNPCDPVAALEYAAQLMRNHLATWEGNWALALSAYNAGPGATASGVKGQLPGWPYAETVNYVASILDIGTADARVRLMGVRPVVTYDKQYPEMGQNDPWSCGPTALRWALHALGRRPSEQWIEDTMIAEGVVSKADGILDATGAGIAAFVRRQYGEFGIDANHEPIISYDWAVNEGGHAYPFLIGGRAWGHWAAVRDYDAANDRLLLMNPAEGWMGVGQAMTRQQFQALGPFSSVRVWHPDLLAPPVVEPPVIVPPDPDALLLAEVRADLRAILAKLDAAGVP